MFATLGDRLTGIFDKLTRRGILTETAVDEQPGNETGEKPEESAEEPETPADA